MLSWRFEKINAKFSIPLTNFSPNGSGDIFFHVMYCLHEVALTLRLKKIGTRFKANSKQ